MASDGRCESGGHHSRGECGGGVCYCLCDERHDEKAVALLRCVKMEIWQEQMEILWKASRRSRLSGGWVYVGCTDGLSIKPSLSLSFFSAHGIWLIESVTSRSCKCAPDRFSMHLSAPAKHRLDGPECSHVHPENVQPPPTQSTAHSCQMYVYLPFTAGGRPSAARCSPASSITS